MKRRKRINRKPKKMVRGITIVIKSVKRHRRRRKALKRIKPVIKGIKVLTR